VSEKAPLVLDSRQQIQQLQPSDALDADKVKLAGQDDFQRLQNNFRLLILTMVDAGFKLPDELLKEMERYAG
jgi:DNA recombination-dependent growth factor C